MKVVRLNEGDIQRMVKRVLNEEVSSDFKKLLKLHGGSTTDEYLETWVDTVFPDGKFNVVAYKEVNPNDNDKWLYHQNLSKALIHPDIITEFLNTII